VTVVWEGCPFGGLFSTQSSTLPAAKATGNLIVRPFSIVTKIIYDKEYKKGNRRGSAGCRDNKTYVYNSRIFFPQCFGAQFCMGVI